MLKRMGIHCLNATQINNQFTVVPLSWSLHCTFSLFFRSWDLSDFYFLSWSFSVNATHNTFIPVTLELDIMCRNTCMSFCRWGHDFAMHLESTTFCEEPDAAAQPSSVHCLEMCYFITAHSWRSFNGMSANCNPSISVDSLLWSLIQLMVLFVTKRISNGWISVSNFGCHQFVSFSWDQGQRYLIIFGQFVHCRPVHQEFWSMFNSYYFFLKSRGKIPEYQAVS